MTSKNNWEKKAFYTALTLLALYLGGCAFNLQRLQANFEAVADGTGEAALIATMGLPDEFDSDNTVNHFYADRPCEAPCVLRAWYYNRFLPKGLEAWSFELSRDGRVVRSSHWVSP